MEIKSCLTDNRTGALRQLNIIFDTGAYITTIDTRTLIRAGYNPNKGRNAEFKVVGYENNIPAKEVLLRGLELGGLNDKRIALGPVLVYATDMSEMNTPAVLGLNVIREFETRLIFGESTFVELTPNFDINNITAYENFIPHQSRFGLT
jgi:hypothetical protein